MRIHRLWLEAFGPFPDAVEVDLDALGAGGLFLIHGPTGAGKTSLLDAICYALFADVPGHRSNKGLRSDHAPPGRMPQVILEFTASLQRWRLTRSPAYPRPKLKGTGTVTVPAKVSLEEYTGGTWTAISTRHDEVADKVKDLLGMGLSQFAKVVLLPQGEFAAFLRADAEERRILLERLFDISTYADLEAWLADRRRASAAAADAAEVSVAGSLARIEDVLAQAGWDAEGSEGSEGNSNPADASIAGGAGPVDLPGRLAVLLVQSEEALSASMAATDAASLTEQAAAASLATAKTRAGHRSRAERAAASLAELDSAAQDHAERVEQLAAAQRASALAGHVAGLRRAGAEVERLRLLAESGATELIAHGLPTEPGALEPLEQRLSAHTETARSLQALVDRRAGLQSRLTSATAAFECTDLRVSDLEGARVAAQKKVDEGTGRLEAARAEAPDVDAARDRLEHIRQQRALLTLVTTDEQEAQRLDDARRQSHDEALTARADLLDLRERHLAGMAGELAASLSPEAPCPVCGSCSHPSPTITTDLVERSAVTESEAAVSRAEQALREVEVTLAAVRARLAERRATLGEVDADHLSSDATQAEQALSMAQTQAGLLVSLGGELERLTASVVAVQQELHLAKESAAGAEAVLTQLRADLAEVEDALEEHRQAHIGCPCWSEATELEAWSLQHHDAIVTLVSRGRRLHVDLARASEAAESLAIEVGTMASDAGFAGVDEAEAAQLSDAATTALRAQVRQHHDARASAVAVLDEPEVIAALEGPADDLDLFTADHAAARQALLGATRAQTAAEACRTGLTRLVPETLTALDTRDRAATAARVDRDLADTFAGLGVNNPMRMRLTAYVLAARLERVVAFANERLSTLGSGRFLLEHTDTRSGAGRAGLGLRVLDQWTGQVRETASLSGGESFMASLALALGLAEAVRSEAGGLDLGTLFVDEGFGSLDDESLEEVMSVLDGLQAGGRAVGVVSHVADLRTRIVHQVVVSKTPDGSTVHVKADSAA